MTQVQKPVSAKKVNTLTLEDVLKPAAPIEAQPTKSIDNLNESPLLDSPIKERSYTQNGPTGSMPQLQAPAPQIAQSAPGQLVDDAGPVPVNQPSTFTEGGFKFDPGYNAAMDVPEQPMVAPQAPSELNPGGIQHPATVAGDQQAKSDIDPVVQEAADGLTDTFTSIYKSAIPTIAHQMSKIPTKELKEFVRSGDLEEGAISDVIATNKENLSTFKSQAASDAAMIARPLKKFLAAKNVNVSPGAELAVIGLFVAITYFLMFMNIKKENAALMDTLTSRIRTAKREKEEIADAKREREEIPLMETEEIKAGEKIRG